VSTHLRRLREAGLLHDRRQGASVVYGLPSAGWSKAAHTAWCAVEAAADPVLEADQRRLVEVLDARRRPSGSTWADSVAGQMDRHYSPGRTWQSLTRGLVGLTRLGRVLDVASGDGAVAELLAPRADRVTCVDISPSVVQAGRRRLAHLGNVEFVQGDMHGLPVADDSTDHVLLMAALCYAHDPASVFREVARVLVPGGDLVAVDLRTHIHAEVVDRYDHVQQGFEPEVLRAWARGAGLEVDLCAATGRERRSPHFEILTLHARRPNAR
jgi:ArsR family transcriptional regulator